VSEENYFLPILNVWLFILPNNIFLKSGQSLKATKISKKRRQNSNDCDVIRLNRVNPKLCRTILASEDASEKTFLTNTSKSCWKKKASQWKKTWLRRIVKASWTKLFLAPVPPKEIRQLAPQKIATSFKFHHKWKKHQTLHGFVTFKST